MNTKVWEQKHYVFSQPHPCRSKKARALFWSWKENKQPPGEVPSERSQQQKSWQASACQQFSTTRRSSLSSHQLLLSFQAEFLPPWDAEGHKRFSCPLTGFCTILKFFHMIFFSPYPPSRYKVTRPRLCEHRAKSSKIQVLPPLLCLDNKIIVTLFILIGKHLGTTPGIS